MKDLETTVLKKAWWQSSTFKFFVVVFLTLFMCIPMAFVNGLVGERKSRYENVQKDIGEHWGQAQGLIGPVLFIPFQSDPKKPQQYAVLLPDHLAITGQLKPQIRHRGIFQSVVYTGDLVVNAMFLPKTTLTDAEGEMLHPKWTNATIGLGLNDSTGLLSGTLMKVDGKTIENLQPASKFSGIQAPVDLLPFSQRHPLHLSMRVRVNGSRGIAFAPAGKQSMVNLTGMHNKPSFSGAYLPVEREITTHGFQAKWDVSHLSRRFPQLWRQDSVSLPALNVESLLNPDYDTNTYSAGDNQDLNSRLSTSGFGVTLIEPIDAYKQTERSLKYGILFLALTFLTYFLFERLTRANIHVLQYIMVGLALSLFYLIVLSVSEIAGFPLAYGIATVATVSLISYYSMAFIPRKQRFIMPTVLTGIYAYLFSLLQLEDYSLLFGTIGLFIILAVLMAVTRNLHTQSE